LTCASTFDAGMVVVRSWWWWLVVGCRCEPGTLATAAGPFAPQGPGRLIL
jgi:hypothetical protein